MKIPPVTCTRCETPISSLYFNTGQFAMCPKCRAPMRVEVFPAFVNPPLGNAENRDVLVEGESSCFYHAGKLAKTYCESCGRFLCALCDVEFNGRHICPVCIQTGKQKGKMENLETSRVMYHQIALLIAIGSTFIGGGMFAPISVPVVLYFCIRYWKTPGSLVRNNRPYLVVAFILAMLQVLLWVFLFFPALTRAFYPR